MRQTADILALLTSSALAFSLPAGAQTATDLTDLIASGAVLERIATGLRFAEGPVWDGERLLVSDVQGDTLYEIEGDTFRPVETPTRWANGHTWDVDGHLLAAEHASGEVTRLTDEGAVEIVAARYEGRRLNSPNDVVVRSDGLVFFTDPPFGLAPPYGPVERAAELDFAGVYRVDPAKGDVTLLTKDLTYPNGIAFSRDETILYLSDTGDQTIHAFDVTSGGDLANGRLFADLATEGASGVVDGMKLDANGNLWAVCPVGLCILSPEGILMGTIAVPEPATDVAWGGVNHDLLYVTATTSVYAIQTQTTGIGSGIK